MRLIPLLVLLVLAMSFTIPATYVSGSSPTLHLRIMTYSNSALTMRAIRVQTGGSLYVVVSLVTREGTPVMWTSSVPLQITLAAKKGELTSTDVFITAGNYNTSASFGLILYIAPHTTGIQHIRASAILNNEVQTTLKGILVIPASP